MQNIEVQCLWPPLHVRHTALCGTTVYYRAFVFRHWLISCFERRNNSLSVQLHIVPMPQFRSFITICIIVYYYNNNWFWLSIIYRCHVLHITNLIIYISSCIYSASRGAITNNLYPALKLAVVVLPFIARGDRFCRIPVFTSLSWATRKNIIKRGVDAIKITFTNRKHETPLCQKAVHFVLLYRDAIVWGGIG